MNYNFAQKFFMGLSIVIFVSVNLFAFILTLSLFFVNKPIEILTDESSASFAYGEKIILESGFFTAKIDDTAILIGKSPASFKYSDGNLLEVEYGFVYIEIKRPVNFVFPKDILLLMTGNKVIYDSRDKSIVFLEGEKVFDSNLKAKPNSVIIYEQNVSDKGLFQIYEIDRRIFLTEEYYVELLSYLKSINNLPFSLQKIETPKLDIFGSLNKTTANEFEIITGKVSGDSALTVNNEKIDVNVDGSFTFRAELKSGENIFRFKVFDAYGNSTFKTVTITKTSSLVVSYPF